MSVRFEWNSEKAALNISKHEVSLEEASTVFDDPLARIFDDPDHSVEERREIIIGRSIKGELLLVCFLEREEDLIRIISARSLTITERKDYEEANGS
jgi:uncharacterized DUF497 family protein